MKMMMIALKIPVSGDMKKKKKKNYLRDGVKAVVIITTAVTHPPRVFLFLINFKLFRDKTVFESNVIVASFFPHKQPTTTEAGEKRQQSRTFKMLKPFGLTKNNP